MPAQFLLAAPQFASTDFDRTVAFYAQFGFTEVARYPQGYLLIRREGVELHFNQRGPDLDPKANFNSAYVRLTNIAALPTDWAHVDLPTEGCPRYVPPKLQPWGMIEAHTIDPDGNLVFYGAVHETAPET